jgi:UTP:GlnB (protein PII) uridylyltransferase
MNSLIDLKISFIEKVNKAKTYALVLKLFNKYNLEFLNLIKKELKEFNLKDIAVCTVGSASRNALSFYSDLDVLIVHKKGVGLKTIKDLSYKLFNLGIEVSVTTRTLSEIKEIKPDDFKSIFSLLSAKFLIGEKDVFKKIDKKRFNYIKKFFKKELKIPSIFLNLKTSDGGIRVLSLFYDFIKKDKVVKDTLILLNVVRFTIHSRYKRKKDTLDEEVLRFLEKKFSKSFLKKFYSKIKESVFIYNSYFNKIKPFIKKPRIDYLIDRIYDFYLSDKLYKIIPEFKNIKAYIHRVGFHVFPVDQHIVESVMICKSIFTNKTEFDFINKIVLSLDKKERDLVFYSLFLHDIGKNKGGGHSTKGSIVAKKILKRFNLNKSDIENVSFLIKNHLLIHNATLKENLNSEKVIKTLVNKIDGISNLKKLSILSFCDLKATNPNANISWQVSVIKDFYFKIKTYIKKQNKRFSLKEYYLWAKENKIDLNNDLKNILKIIPNPFLKYNTNIDIYNVLKLLFKTKKEVNVNVNIKLLNEDLGSLLITMPKDRVGVFYSISIVLLKYGLSIFYASIHSMKDGSVFDKFLIKGISGFNKNKLNNLKKDLIKVLDKKEKLELPIDYTRRNLNKDFNLNFYDENNYTVMTLECMDRYGLLFNITRFFVDLKISLSFAKVNTFHRKAIDVFHLSYSKKSLNDDLKSKLSNKVKNFFKNS